MTRADLDRGWTVGVARRVGLAVISVAGVYVLVSLPMLARVELGIIEYVGLTDLFTFVVFVLPLVCLVPSTLQLRYWYLLLLASTAFLCGVLTYLMSKSPWALLKHEDFGRSLVFIGLLVALGSCGTYLYLLRLVAARAANESLTRRMPT